MFYPLTLHFFFPRKTFWHIAKRRSTEDFESIPYICKLLNAYMWVYYGVVKPNSVLVATVNGFGAVAEIVYIIIFLLFAPSRMRVCFTYLDFVSECVKEHCLGVSRLKIIVYSP